MQYRAIKTMPWVVGKLCGSPLNKDALYLLRSSDHKHFSPRLLKLSLNGNNYQLFPAKLTYEPLT